MIPDKTPNASRIVLARTRRGLTKVALARRAGISTRALYDLESGKATPTGDTLVAIAEALRFPVGFFYRPDVELPSADEASFRSLRSMTASKRDAALAAGALAFEVSDWIEERFTLPPPQVPDLHGYDPEAAASAVRALWKMGASPIGNMIHQLESRGVRVFSLAEDRRVDAFSLWHTDKPYVFLNTVKTAEHSRMDAAHELGHLVLHRRTTAQGRNIESQAQLFASAFLMPRSSVMATPKLMAPTLGHLVQLKKKWLVSAAALAHRLHNLGLLSDWNYRGLCIDLARFGRDREPEGIARETSQIMDKVFGLSVDGVSKRSVASDLDLNQSDVEALVFGIRATASTDSQRSPAKSRMRTNLRAV